jgi:hypothetical protein
MSSKIWRFSYEQDSLKEITESGKLVFPDINPHIAGKHNSIAKIVEDISIGCFIILANFKSFENTGTVRAGGIVTEISGNDISVHWKRIVPSISLHPHKIGAEQWERESVFLINAPRAKEFKLDALKKKLFP